DLDSDAVFQTVGPPVQREQAGLEHAREFGRRYRHVLLIAGVGLSRDVAAGKTHRRAADAFASVLDQAVLAGARWADQVEQAAGWGETRVHASKPTLAMLRKHYIVCDHIAQECTLRGNAREETVITRWQSTPRQHA